ncbi:MAG: transposase [Spirochaetales bacterium]|nr:transposase [Spirochaetales bacterium]MCF7938256.1 transposase [Spirochaetales bacterium]
MRFYSQHHQFYAGVDLHARSIFICIIDEKGETRFHRNFPADTAHLNSALEPFMPDVLVGVECIFSWYWVADFCEDHHLPFALGHALYMKAIHGGKTKNDKIDSHKISLMLRSGMFPSAYVYPRHMRAARDLLRRRQYFVHQQSELLAHIQITNMQYNLPDFEKNISYSANRTCLSDRFPDPDVQKSVEADVHLLDAYHRTLIDIEAQIKRRAGLSVTTRSLVSSCAPSPASVPSSLL